MSNRSQAKNLAPVRPVTEWSGTSLVSGATWNIHHGDALKVLQKLPAATYNCVITSPPYYWLRDYGMRGQIGHEESFLDTLTLSLM